MSCASVYKHKHGKMGNSIDFDAIDWVVFQKIHDSGVFFNNLPKETGMPISTLNKAVSLGLLIKHKHKYNTSPETRKLQSNSRKQWLQQNPDKHVWKRNSKFVSVPCEKLKNFLRDQSIKFVEEVTVSNTRNFAVDILIPSKNLIIEVNGNQHYNADGTLKKYYKKRHDHIISLGWHVIELHYTLVFDHDLVLNLINGFVIESQVLPFVKREKKSRNKYGSRKEYNAISKSKYDEEQQKYIPIILNSEIEFSKFGWVGEVAKIINKTPQKVNAWMKRYMLDFYQENCFKRKIMGL